MRYLLVDRIEEMRKLRHATAVKCITLSDDAFEHHFPGLPIYPGALLLESLAQLGGLLLECSLKDVLDYIPRCALSSSKLKLRQFVRPGDRLDLRVDVVSRHEDSALCRASASRDGEKVAEAEILYVFFRVDDPRLHAAREQYLDVVTAGTRFVE